MDLIEKVKWLREETAVLLRECQQLHRDTKDLVALSHRQRAERSRRYARPNRSVKTIIRDKESRHVAL